MSVGILLVIHQGLGPAPKAAARRIRGDTLPMPVEKPEVPADANLAQLRSQANALLAGVNLPMLLRMLNHADRSLTDLVNTALEGGLSSIFLAKTAIR